MKTITFTCRKSDIRRIKITCRCGEVTIAEIPQQVARAMNFHPCPKCQAGFLITRDETGKWQIERAVESVSEMAIMHGDQAPTPENSYVGLRIRIVDGGKNQMGDFVGTNPHPEHVGKSGTIVGEENCGGGHTTPVIKLDDGTRLTGAECWWEPVKN
jgi:hypothetical protein